MSFKKQFLVDSILTHRRIHLLGGISSAGKTRFILPAMVKWSKGEPFLGFASHPIPWAYVSGDRKTDEALETLDDLKIDPADVPIISAFGREDKTAVQVLKEARDKGYQLLVWEGFGDFVAPPAHKHQVRQFLSNLSAICDEFPNGLSILGIMESPKLKPNEMYKSPRQLISGVSSWGYHTSTVAMILQEDPEDEKNSHRILHVDIKGYPKFKCEGDYDANGHVIFGPPETADSKTDDPVESLVMVCSMLDTLKVGSTFSLELLELTLTNLTQRTIHRALDSLIQTGVIERIKRGTYRKIAPTKMPPQV